MIGHIRIGSGSEGVIVLHGWLGDYTAFTPLLPFLDSDSFSYAFMDYRGYGRSRALSGEHTMQEIAADALSLADHLGWERVHLLGHSMGGMAVQRIALDAPTRVKSIVALTPVPPTGVPFDEAGWALFTGAAEHDAQRRQIIDYTTGNRLSPAWLDYMTRRSRETSDQQAFADYLIAWAKSDFSAEICNPNTPMLVLAGEHDPALGMATLQAALMPHYPHAQLEMLPNAGHYPMQETPVYLATRIERFFIEHS